MKPMELWTVAFDFPNGVTYPTLDESYTSEWNLEVVKYWNSTNEAEQFAREHAGKYGWKLILFCLG